MTIALSRLLKGTTALQNPARFPERLALVIGAGAEGKALSTAELEVLLKDQRIDAAGFSDKTRKTPLNDQAYYDALAQGVLTAERVQKQLEELYAAEKKKRGFLGRAFAFFAEQNGVEKAMSGAAAFEKFTYKHGIKYDSAAQRLVQGDKPRTVLDKAWDNRFLLAAAGGIGLGLAGVNLGLFPILSAAPALFFGVLPWLAAPFIGLNIFKSFSQYSILKESPTLLRFAAITAAGLAISLGVVTGMSAILPVVDPATIAAAAIPGMGGGGFSPMQYMLPIIGAFSAAALVYKRAKGVEAGHSDPAAPHADAKRKISRAYNKAVGLVINRHTAPAITAIGRAGEKATEVINRVFPKFIDIAGVPAIATLLSMTMATGGLGLLGAFAGYYITAFTGLAVGGAAMAAGFYKFGARGKDFREIGSAALTGFSLSSSSATMPKEREALKVMGVSARTRDTVVPLGGVFNMYGTSLYMGLTAFYALGMFGAAPSALQYAKTAGTVMAIALGAPGIPASNITLLDPVLQQTGLAASQINKVYAMVLPADRLLDMTQTALNVLGDMIAAVHPDRKRMRYMRARNITKLRKARLAAEAAKKPANDNLAALNDNKKDVTAGPTQEKQAVHAAAAPKPPAP
ncbi:MAG TPA: cation:dicarboxylase symporter family transporter [Patescibacteria group bacterium]|nr:cation:dicarboxylase symporter family transporter [Patescibacteria group bacterium]